MTEIERRKDKGEKSSSGYNNATMAMEGKGKHRDHIVSKGCSAALLDCLEFPEYTSTHGLPHTKRLKLKLGRIIWSLLVMCGFASFLWQVTLLFQQFLGYDYNVLVDVKFNSNIMFPGMTLCNINPYRHSEMVKLVAEDPKLDEFVAHFMASMNQTTPNRSEALHRLRLLINLLDEERRTAVGHQLNDMLISCTFRGQPCFESNFTHINSFEYGNCYEFNVRPIDGHNGTYLRTYNGGPGNGLELTLFTEINEYVPELSESCGFRIAVHDQSQIPFPHEQGLDVSAGFSTKLGIRRFEIQRLGSPYYECHDSETDGRLNLYHQVLPNSYSRTVCLRSCIQYGIVDTCRCYSAEFPTPPDTGLDFCHKNTTKQDCADKVQLHHATGNVDILCPECEPVCTEIAYTASYAQAVTPVPDDKYVTYHIHQLSSAHHGFANWHNGLLKQNYTSEQINTKVRFAIVRLSIFFEDLNYELLYQKPAMTVIDLISGIGGVSGLWVGMSILSVFEYGELALRMLWRLGQQCCSMSHVGNTQHN